MVTNPVGTSESEDNATFTTGVMPPDTPLIRTPTENLSAVPKEKVGVTNLLVPLPLLVICIA